MSGSNQGEGRRATPKAAARLPFIPVSRHIVVAFLSGYSGPPLADMLHMFLGSLRAARVPAHAALLVEGALNDATLSGCKDVAPLYGAWCVPVADETLSENSRPAGRRWLYFQDFLRALDPAIDGILLTDVRDVLFQGDPFALEGSLTPPFLLFSGELTNILLGDCTWALHRCRACARLGILPRPACAAMAKYPILNNGVVMGSRDALLRLLADFIAQVQAADFRCNEGRPLHPADALSNGMDDQVLFNALMWTQTLATGVPKAVAMAETSRICSVGGGTAVRVDGQGLVINGRGHPCALVHQYDRFQSIKTMVERRFLEGVEPDAAPFVATGDPLTSARLDGRAGAHCGSEFRLSRPHPLSGCKRRSPSRNFSLSAF